MSKQYSSEQELHTKILRGVDILADNVASTLGPRGRNVILHKPGALPIVTKDGVTVASFVDLEDPIENVGAQIIKQASSNTNSIAGDGTTTATVLSREIFKTAQKYLSSGASPVELKRGMDKACTVIVDRLTELSTPIESEEDIKHIATISANNDTSIGELISTAVDQAGKDGAITVEEAKSMDTSLEVVEGFRFDSGYFSKSFVTDERRGLIKYDNPYILVTDHKLEAVDEIYPILELVARDSRPLIFVAEEVEGQALAALIMNATRGTLKVAAIKAPRYGEERRGIMEDLSIASGGTFVSRASGKKLSDVKLVDFGTCKSIEVRKNFTTIVGASGDIDKIEERIESLKEMVIEEEDLLNAQRIQDRITRLASGIAIIKVGAPTEVEMIEKKHRIEDALEAVKSAQAEGMVPGGGVALIRSLRTRDGDMTTVKVENEDQNLGAEIIFKCLEAPLRQMAINAGQSPDLICDLIKNSSGNDGYDFYSNTVTDMIESGIIDPVKVTKTALKNAVSVASTLITTNHAIIET
jgi:chaperonin GroEL